MTGQTLTHDLAAYATRTRPDFDLIFSMEVNLPAQEQRLVGWFADVLSRHPDATREPALALALRDMVTVRNARLSFRSPPARGGSRPVALIVGDLGGPSQRDTRWPSFCVLSGAISRTSPCAWPTTCNKPMHVSARRSPRRCNAGSSVCCQGARADRIGVAGAVPGWYPILARDGTSGPPRGCQTSRGGLQSSHRGASRPDQNSIVGQIEVLELGRERADELRLVNTSILQVEQVSHELRGLGQIRVLGQRRMGAGGRRQDKTYQFVQIVLRPGLVAPVAVLLEDPNRTWQMVNAVAFGLLEAFCIPSIRPSPSTCICTMIGMLGSS